MRGTAPLLPLLLLQVSACGTSRNTATNPGNDAASPIDARADVASEAGGSGGIPQQIVFMLPVSDDGGPPPTVPGGTAVYEVAVANLDGGGVSQLTSDGLLKFLPHFSPDGTRIAYTKFATGGYGVPGSLADIAVLDLATHVETLVTHGGGNVQATWSPDGTRIAYLDFGSSVGATPGAIWIVNADGSDPTQVAACPGTPLDMMWGDIAWSREDWILFSVGQTTPVDGGGSTCFKVRTDKMLPDGGSRTQVTAGGPNCTPMGAEQSGDADPGWSSDGGTIYSSRGFPMPPAGLSGGATMRKLYAFSSDPWYPGKPEMDLSLPSEPSCIEGVPKGSPDGTQVLLFRACFDHGPAAQPGVYVTDTSGSYRRFVVTGFGPDWNPRPKAP